MRSLSRTLARVSIACLALSVTDLSGAAVKRPAGKAAADNAPAQAVRAALESELSGNAEGRARNLAEALRLDPECAAARWQSGYVRWNGQWRTPDEVAAETQSDERRAEYRRRRDGMIDTADNHRELAQWCHRQKLLEEERVHWMRVLAFEPGNPDVFAALGLQWHNGRLLTRVEIEQEKIKAGERLRATRYWQPKMAKWRNAIANGSPKQRAEAMEQLAQVNDPETLPSLEAAFANNDPGKRGLELNEVLIETAGRLRNPAATGVLLRRALVPDAEEVRAAAAAELKKRPMHAYVPFLIAGCPESTQSRFEYCLVPIGSTVYVKFDVTSQGRNFECHVRQDSLHSAFIGAGIGTDPIQRQLAAFAQSATRQLSVEQRQKQWRDRFRYALQETTGFAESDDPKLWQKQWDEYSGRYSSSSSGEPYYVHEIALQPMVRVAMAAPPTATPTGAAGSSGEWHRDQPRTTTTVSNTGSSMTVTSETNTRAIECFAAGTPVTTLLGSKPIESIRTGDRVLAQDVTTGELGYKTVEGTTIRHALTLTRLSFGSDSIDCTPGHPFWVVGHGWRMAKELQVGDWVHGIQGALEVNAVDVGPTTEAYNLIVEDSHNYFVGDRRVLVHDNQGEREQSAIVPGLVREVASSSGESKN